MLIYLWYTNSIRVKQEFNSKGMIMILDKIKEMIGLQSPAETFWKKIPKLDNPYVFERERYTSWGNRIHIDKDGRLFGSFKVNPRLRDGDLITYDCVGGGKAVCKIMDISYHSDPYDMVEDGVIFRIGKINENGELDPDSMHYDFAELTEVEKEALRSFYMEGKQKHGYKGLLI